MPLQMIQAGTDLYVKNYAISVIRKHSIKQSEILLQSGTGDSKSVYSDWTVEEIYESFAKSVKLETTLEMKQLKKIAKKERLTNKLSNKSEVKRGRGRPRKIML